MVYSKIPLNIFLKDYNLPIPTKESLKRFQKHLNNFLRECQKQTTKDTSESEEFQKNLFADFLKQAFSYPKINTKQRIDLAIYENDEVKTFFEVKLVANKKEFPKSQNTLDLKAFYESLLYYIREREQGNNHIKFISLCTIDTFYIIKSKYFEKLYQKQRHTKTLQRCRRCRCK